MSTPRSGRNCAWSRPSAPAHRMVAGERGPAYRPPSPANPSQKDLTQARQRLATAEASQVAEHLRAAFQTGLAPLVETLRARERRFALERQNLELQRDYALARVRYEATRGLPPAPPRRK